MVGRSFHKNRFKIPGQNLSTRLILIREKKFIQHHYDFLSCSIKKNYLVCKGNFKPTEYSTDYKFKITYNGISSPDIHVIEPQIEYSDDIHMYPKGKSLCLYHPQKDQLEWDARKHNLYETIIPWTLEWFVYYELYLINGRWEHPYVPHKRIKK